MPRFPPDRASLANHAPRRVGWQQPWVLWGYRLSLHERQCPPLPLRQFPLSNRLPTAEKFGISAFSVESIWVSSWFLVLGSWWLVVYGSDCLWIIFVR